MIYWMVPAIAALRLWVQVKENKSQMGQVPIHPHASVPQWNGRGEAQIEQ